MVAKYSGSTTRKSAPGALTRRRRRLIGAREAANVFARPERQPGNACDAGDTRHRPELLVELLVRGDHLRRRIARRRQRNGEDAQPGRIEPDVGVLHRRHAAQQQAGAEQQHDRETDFGDEQHRSRPSPSHRADGAALSQRLRQRRARQLQRRSEPEEQRRTASQSPARTRTCRRRTALRRAAAG